MKVLHEIQNDNWQGSYSHQTQSEAIEAFEGGQIILLPQLNFVLMPHEEIFLSTKFSVPNSKNISYNPARDQLRGTTCQGKMHEDLKAMMARYADSAKHLMDQLFPTYQSNIQLGRTSFRPIEIFGRIPKSYRKDDTRLHVDAFPMSPTQGKRIIRVFTNINPDGKDRFWRVGEHFEEVAKRFLPKARKAWWGRSILLNTLGLTKSYCTEYDYIMLQFHNKMKADLQYQKEVSKQDIYFKPKSSWIVQTDSVSHAALAGQYVLEQTFYLPVDSMKQPQFSPLRTLEKLTGRVLVG